jgi:hypothetical protein
VRKTYLLTFNHKILMHKNQLFTILLLVFAAGCGGGPKGIPTNYVEGIVTLDGQSLESALVTFIPAASDGKVAKGHTDAAGKYTLTSVDGVAQKGALAGDYTVTIVKMDIKKVPKKSSGPPRPTSQYDVPEMSIIQTLMTPAVYSEAKTTPLKATVVKGKNDIPLALTKTP